MNQLDATINFPDWIIEYNETVKIFLKDKKIELPIFTPLPNGEILYPRHYKLNGKKVKIIEIIDKSNILHDKWDIIILYNNEAFPVLREWLTDIN